MNQQQRDRGAEQKRAHQARVQLIGVRATERLRSEPGRTHAQEAEHEIKHVEGERADRDRPEVVGLGQMPDDGGIDDAKERHR
jgi:hypothetical protein